LRTGRQGPRNPIYTLPPLLVTAGRAPTTIGGQARQQVRVVQTQRSPGTSTPGTTEAPSLDENTSATPPTGLAPSTATLMSPGQLPVIASWCPNPETAVTTPEGTSSKHSSDRGIMKSEFSPAPAERLEGKHGHPQAGPVGSVNLTSRDRFRLQHGAAPEDFGPYIKYSNSAVSAQVDSTSLRPSRSGEPFRASSARKTISTTLHTVSPIGDLSS